MWVYLSFRTNNVDDHVVQQNSGLMVDLKKVSGKELIKNNHNLVHANLPYSMIQGSLPFIMLLLSFSVLLT